MDEFSAVSRRLPVWQLYERARSLGLAVQVSAQSWQGLGGDESERLRIAASADGGIWLLRTPHPDPVVALAGNRKRIDTTRRLMERAVLWGSRLLSWSHLRKLRAQGDPDRAITPPYLAGDEPGQSFQGKLARLPAAIYCRVSFNPDKSETKSVDDQRAEGLEWARRTGVKLTEDDIYTDDDFSASRYAVKDRTGFSRAPRGDERREVPGDLVLGDEPTDQGRHSAVGATAECEQHGVLWCFSGALYNPANDDDSMILEIHHVIDKKYSAQLAKDVRRGKKSAAEAGRRGAAPVYGYRRCTTARHGSSSATSRTCSTATAAPSRIPPPISCARIARLYRARGFPRLYRARDFRPPRWRRFRRPHPPRPGEPPGPGARPQTRGDMPGGEYHWSPRSIRDIATNPFYIGKRVYQNLRIGSSGPHRRDPR